MIGNVRVNINSSKCQVGTSAVDSMPYSSSLQAAPATLNESQSLDYLSITEFMLRGRFCIYVVCFFLNGISTFDGQLDLTSFRLKRPNLLPISTSFPPKGDRRELRESVCGSLLLEMGSSTINVGNGGVSRHRRTFPARAPSIPQLRGSPGSGE